MKSNLYKKIRTFLFTTSLVGISMYAMTNAGGPPVANTGAPGDNTCGQSSCHNFSPITSGTAWNNITLTGVPVSGYVPGTTYTMTLTNTQAGHSVFGFQTTVLNSSNIMAGTLAAGGGSAAQSDGAGRTYLNHTSGGTTGSGGSKSWSFSWTAPSPGMGVVTFYAALNAANGDASNSGDTIFTKGFVFYQTGTAPPTATISADKSTVCQNDTVRFTGGGANSPTGFTWTIPSATFVSGTASNSQNPIVVFSGSAGTKSVSLVTTNSNGNSQPAAFPVVVNALPTATTTPTGAVSICGSDSLNVSAASGANYAYLWSPGNQTTQSIYLKTAGTYAVKITNTATGCVKTSNNIVATIRTIPTVNLATSTDSICKGDSVTFSATAGMSNYEFYRDTTRVQNSASATFKGAPSSSALVYKVFATDVNGCRSLSSNTKQVNVQTPLVAPTVNCDSVSVSFIRFAWNAVAGADAYQVSIDSGKTWITPSSGATGLTHSVSGLGGATKVNLSVRATQSSGKCSKGDIGKTTCQTSGCVAVTFSLSYDSIFCNPTATDSASITVSGVNTPKYSVKVDQVNASGVFIANVYPYSAGNTFKVKLNGTNLVYYKFSVLDSVQVTCPAGTANASIKGVVSPAAAPTITFGKSVNVLCDNETATFTFSKPAGTDKYDVMNNNTLLGQTTSTSASYPATTFNNNDVVTVIAINNATGCSRKSSGITLTRKATPKAGFTFTRDKLAVQFTDTTPSSSSWAWDFDVIGATSTVQNPSHTYVNDGSYNVTLHVVTTDLCKSDTALRNVVVSNVGIATIAGIGKVTFYPNPVKSQLFVELNVMTNNQQVSFEVHDLQGRTVNAPWTRVGGNGNNNQYTIDLSELTKAVYSVLVKVGNKQQAFSILKD